MWVCRNVIGTTLIFDGWNPTHIYGDEWGMVQMALRFTNITSSIALILQRIKVPVPGPWPNSIKAPRHESMLFDPSK